MKRLIAMLLCAAVCLSLAACKGSDTFDGASSADVAEVSSKYVHDVDIMSYVSNGVIPELPIKLGDFMDKVKSEYGYSESGPEPTESLSDEELMGFYHDDESFGMMLDEGYLEVKASTGDAYYLYKTRYEGYGISRMFCLTDCFGFKNGITLRNQVMDAVSLEPSEVAENVEKIDVLPGTPEKCSSVSYTDGDYTVTFYFMDDFLFCTSICDNRYWFYED